MGSIRDVNTRVLGYPGPVWPTWVLTRVPAATGPSVSQRSLSPKQSNGLNGPCVDVFAGFTQSAVARWVFSAGSGGAPTSRGRL